MMHPNLNNTLVKKCKSRNIPCISGWSACLAYGTTHRHAPRSSKSRPVSPIPDLDPYPAPLASLCCRRCLCSTLRLKLVPLTYTGVKRNKLYQCMSHRCLGLQCPIAPLACLCCRRFLRSTLGLKLVPLTYTGVRRNKPCRCMSHRCLGLRCPISLGSPPLWAIPLPVSRPVTAETYHQPCLTGIPTLTFALIVVTLY